MFRAVQYIVWLQYSSNNNSDIQVHSRQLDAIDITLFWAACKKKLFKQDIYNADDKDHLSLKSLEPIESWIKELLAVIAE